MTTPLDNIPLHARVLATYSIECACGAKHSQAREMDRLDGFDSGYFLRSLAADAYRRGWHYGPGPQGDRWRCCYCFVADHRASARPPITGDPIRTALERG